MQRFDCDYGEGAHPRVLELLTATNLEQLPGYGEDVYCAKARKLLLASCGQNVTGADVHFVIGGTQANALVIAAALKPWQGALCAVNGHINIHEAGAIEASGHKVLALPSKEGKISAEKVGEAVEAHRRDAAHEHMVQPGMVYLSNPTEFGTLYSKTELAALSKSCRALGLSLYVDGARMGYGLMAEGNDLTLADYAQLCDAFTIGGTKVGALFGEAVILMNPSLRRDFRYLMKQRGAMLAKGRLLGLQFLALFEDGLYFRVAAHANALALRLRHAFEERGWPLLFDSKTNQQFPVIPDGDLALLAKRYAFEEWQRIDNTRRAVRFCTSWATTEKAVEELICDINVL